MGRIGLKSKLKRLEKRQGKRRVNALALEFDCDATGAPTSPEMAAWLSTPNPRSENAPAAFLARYAGILNSRVILFPRFASEAAWETAAAKQQSELMAHARSRTNEPANTAPPNVGNRFEDDDAPAPKRNGEKGRRFVELADGRTFDTETRQYVDEDGKPIAKAGGLSVEWKQ